MSPETDRILQNQVAIVTGAGKGLGRACALHLASLGAKIVVNNRRTGQQASSADAVVDEIHALGGKAVANYLSVEDTDSGVAIVEQAIEAFGQLDIVIANAGVDRSSSFHKQNMQDFEYVMQINFSSVARLMHAAWPVLREARYGRVLFVTSTAGLYSNFGQAAYSSSKAALQGLMKTLAIEGKSRGIGVNSIAPYAFTQMTASAIPDKVQARLLSPDAVSGLVAWLCSSRCEVTGHTFIAAAGHARLAQLRETATMPFTADIQILIDHLENADFAHSYTDASSEFSEFIQSF